MRRLIAALALAHMSTPALATETCYPEDGAQRLAGTYSIFDRTIPGDRSTQLVDVAVGPSRAGGLIWCHLEGDVLLRVEETGPNGARAFYRDGPVWANKVAFVPETPSCIFGQGPCTTRDRDWQGQLIRTYDRTCTRRDGEMWYRSELTGLQRQDWSTGVRTDLPAAWQERDVLWQVFDDAGRLMEERRFAWRSDDLNAPVPSELPLQSALTLVASGPLSDLPCLARPEACAQGNGLALCKEISAPLLADP